MFSESTCSGVSKISNLLLLGQHVPQHDVFPTTAQWTNFVFSNDKFVGDMGHRLGVISTKTTALLEKRSTGRYLIPLFALKLLLSLEMISRLDSS
jgi:hypothetical protein